MKNHRILLLLCLLIFGLNSANSQNLTFGATANVGLSKVASNLPFPEENKVKFAPSGNLGIFLERKISQHSSFGIEALWVQIEGKEVTKNLELSALTDQGPEVVGVISGEFYLHSSYVGIPIYYRFEAGNFGFKGGVQPMIFLCASSYEKSYGEMFGEPYNNENQTKGIEFDRIDIGPKLGLDYRLNDRLKLRADYYHGLSDITSNEFPWQQKNRQISFGIQYIFWGRK